MPIESLIALLLASMIVKATPGPGVFATIAQSVTYGLGTALWFVLGVMLGDLFYIVAVLLGLSLIAREFQEIFLAVRLIGGGYLIYLGYRAFVSGATDVVPAAGRYGSRRALFNGLLLTLGNPKVILFYVGLMPTFVDLGKLDGADMVVLCLVLTLDLGAILSGYALAARRARRLFTSPSSRRWMNRSAGTVLIGSGVAVISTS